MVHRTGLVILFLHEKFEDVGENLIASIPFAVICLRNFLAEIDNGTEKCFKTVLHRNLVRKRA